MFTFKMHYCVRPKSISYALMYMYRYVCPVKFYYFPFLIQKYCNQKNTIKLSLIEQRLKI